MTEKEKEPVTFSIHERLAFIGQYAAEEFLSMALEPDMTIEEDAHFVKVTGNLRLTGEFRPVSSTEYYAQSTDHYKQANPVKSIFPTDVGTYCIEHDFPVDITIPSYRIDNMEDLYVTIDAFDYFLENTNAIDLSADILLSGLSSTLEKSTVASERHPEDDKYLGVPSYENYFSDKGAFPFQFDNDESIPQNNERREETWHSIQGDEESVDTDHSILHEEGYEFEAIRNPDEHPFLEETTVPHLEIKERKEPSAEEFSESDSIDSESFDSESFDSELPEEECEVQYEYERQSDLEVEEPVQQVAAVERPKENALYLTKMLSDDTKSFSKQRMYFIQPGDSLSSVAEKYKLAATSLIRLNRLESDQLTPGDIIYIPVK